MFFLSILFGAEGLMVGWNVYAEGALLAITLIGGICLLFKDRRDNRLLDFNAAIEYSTIVWGFWHTGGEAVWERHIKSGVIKRILLLRENDEESLKHTTTITG